ncbi:hypothetical protein ASPZODRAFT_151389 [Penicilliopsis zonata CBS 506.65]|uniref:Zn(2)-C6 fungal-type domain-containing protein n=1 Tax=Penicilliopsis zonata CBS 506.65 TaxID=1073090 RepID=A0A1L9SLC2_9EURO|nr:hypothetical protein ASPZODRAFT_151389 [Penicilliopsis zonata CBS 506.65]OJJ47978.1 hypothetical protein ASPZODRAFT_151389 [Penicilliopsis zonata CBS 506.65]
MSPKRRVQPDEEEPNEVEVIAKRQKKFVACQRCHTHKIKCSGEQPCSKCRQVGCADECQYAARDRKLRVSEAYLQNLLAENRRLKEQSVSGSTTEASTPPPGAARVLLQTQPSHTTDLTDESGTAVTNPLIGDRAWFHPYDPAAPPIFIGEAACTAFATRFRRFLTGSNTTPHIRRTQYVSEEALAAANATQVRWPTLQQARLLVRIALHQIGRLYHMLLRKSTLDKLEEIYQTGEFDCPINQGKYFALFAFGEAYTVRSEPGMGSKVPGTSYFARALSLIQILPERTSMVHLETLLLLSLFSYFLNRRHSAYILISNAMRLSLNIGLNHNIPESQLIDPVERQHRVRIWWTIYIFDRVWGSKMGLPIQILDEDIHVDMPSDIHPPELQKEQFSDTEYFIANIKLARIAGDTITMLYSRRKYTETFLQRVQKLLKALKNWLETLPERIRLTTDDAETNKKHITSLHLSFNQCVILATRPTMLHLLITLSEHDAHPQDHPSDTVSQAVLTLGEACIHAARHSHTIILDKWINGSLPPFGYFHAQYLFSSALILAMASFVPLGAPSDLAAFETALEVLRSVSANGNLAALEFFHNLEQVRACLGTYREERRNSGSARHNAKGHAAAAIGPGGVRASPVPSPRGSTTTNPPELDMAHALAPVNPFSGFTTEMAFLEPTMQNFLAQSDFDLGLMHPMDSLMNDAESLYTYLTPALWTE